MVVTPSEHSSSRAAYYSARPTVKINDQSYPLVDELLQSMEMHEWEGGLSALELRFSNVASYRQGEANLPFEDDAILNFGAVVQVCCGHESGPQEIFRGKITGLTVEYQTETGAPELLVMAEDALQQARMERRTQVHNNVSIAQLGRDLASRLGLEARITGLSDNIGTQVQLNESDLAFLRRLIARYDGDLQVVGNELQLSRREEIRRSEIPLVLHTQLSRFRVVADLAHQVTEVTVNGWNPNSGRAVRGRSVGASAGPGAGRTGAQVLSNIVEQRPHHIGHLTVSTDAEAQAIADAAFDRRARQFLCIEGTAEGNPEIRVGTWLAIDHISDRFDNTYYVIEACHRWFQSATEAGITLGYETDFVAECAYWGGDR